MIYYFLNKFYTILRISFLVLYTTSASFGSDQFITLQSTSSVRDSGLLKFILPKFTDQYHVKVKVIANGTGQAIKNAKDCNGDLLLVHSKQDEIDFVNQGYGIKRYDLMYNDFIIVGPADNNLNINANNTLSEVLTKISVSNSKFISRSDDSGTHKKELMLWESSNISINDNSKWYIEAGQGMGATLNIAVGINGFTLTDRSTWLNFMNKADHVIIYQSKTELINYYGITIVNPKHCPDTKLELSQKLVEWLISSAGKTLIDSYTIDGNQVFFTETYYD